MIISKDGEYVGTAPMIAGLGVVIVLKAALSSTADSGTANTALTAVQRATGCAAEMNVEPWHSYENTLAASASMDTVIRINNINIALRVRLQL